jgi:AraC-like DNA-binding protein
MSNIFKEQIKIITEKNLKQEIGFSKTYLSSKTAIFIVKKGYFSFINSFEKITLIENNIYLSFPRNVFQLINVSPDLEINIVALDVDLVDNFSLDFNRLDAYQFFISNYLNHFNISKPSLIELDGLVNLLQLNVYKKSNSTFKKAIVLNLISVLIYTVLDAINAQINIDNRSKTNRKQELVLEFLKLPSIHFKNERNLSFYAKNLKVTIRHLSATIKNVTKKTANQVIHQQIISESKFLLASTNKKITEITAELNFNDQYYFSNFFKKNTGLSPSQFRTQNKKEYIYTSI